MASSEYFDEDRKENRKEEVGLRHGNVPTNRT